MKRLALGIAATTCLVLTGCGAGPTPAASSNNSASTGSQNTVAASTASTSGNTTVNNTTTSTSSNSVSVSDLQPYEGFQSQGISVSTPKGWDVSTSTGGDYKSITLSNPADAKEQIRLIYSTCVGCYMNANGQPDPAKVISVHSPTNVKVAGTGGLTATYDFGGSSKVYAGKGMVLLSSNQSGYAEINVSLSETNQAVVDAILKSFNFAS